VRLWLFLEELRWHRESTNRVRFLTIPREYQVKWMPKSSAGTYLDHEAAKRVNVSSFTRSQGSCIYNRREEFRCNVPMFQGICWTRHGDLRPWKNLGETTKVSKVYCTRTVEEHVILRVMWAHDRRRPHNLHLSKNHERCHHRALEINRKSMRNVQNVTNSA
jgi:hypothetical protein